MDVLNNNDFSSAISSAIKQSVETEYENYKKSCIENLEQYLARQKNNIVQNILDSIDISVQKDSIAGQVNVQIKVIK